MARQVLLIDDDRLQFRVTQAHFAGFQSDTYGLDWAGTYDEGLAKLVAGDYAACLLDYQLGERDGLQLIREAIAQGCRTPIVFLTAETADRVDIAAMHAGALDYLVKGEITSRMLERSLRYAVKLAETLDALRRLATRDQLTGLLNRREFDRIMQEEEERALRFGHPLALIMVDVDRFKSVNDTHGHPVGDAVLQEIARRLATQIRTVDRVARLGGEEFGLVLVQSDQASALQIAQRVCDVVRSEPLRVSETLTLPVTVSAGVAALPHDAATAAALIVAADKALYSAKKYGTESRGGFQSTLIVAEKSVERAAGRLSPASDRAYSGPALDHRAMETATSSMEQRLSEQFGFLLEIDKLKNVLRQNILSDQSRRENSAEHSWHLAVMALCLEEYAEAPVDLFAVTKMLLIHDVIEIDAGDAFLHTLDELENQREKEIAAAKRIFSLLPADQCATFQALWIEFESGSSREAKFARVIDRVQPALLHGATGAVIWRKYGTTHSQILRKLEFIEKDAPKLWPRIKRVIDEAVASGALVRD